MFKKLEAEEEEKKQYPNVARPKEDNTLATAIRSRWPTVRTYPIPTHRNRTQTLARDGRRDYKSDII